MSPVTETAINRLQEISADERMREIYRAREKARLDMLSRLKSAEKLGMEKGMEKGRVEGIREGAVNKAREMAQELIKDGMEVSLVAKYTKLTINEVEGIKKSM
jgi:predicted transposase/invertase (TIGR01784 family)